jgi:hypothetical protein
VFHVNFFTLQQNIDNLSELQIARGVEAQVAILILGLRLQPE